MFALFLRIDENSRTGLTPIAVATVANSITSKRRSPRSTFATNDCGLSELSASSCCVNPARFRAPSSGIRPLDAPAFAPPRVWRGLSPTLQRVGRIRGGAFFVRPRAVPRARIFAHSTVIYAVAANARREEICHGRRYRPSRRSQEQQPISHHRTSRLLCRPVPPHARENALGEHRAALSPAWSLCPLPHRRPRGMVGGARGAYQPAPREERAPEARPRGRCS